MPKDTGHDLISELEGIVGRAHVLTGAATERFARGWRSGAGRAMAVVRPGTLVEMWRALKACVAADTIIIMQAANTGLTEGSTPKGSYDRPVVVFSTLRLDALHLLGEGEQVVSLPGGTLYKLEALLDPLGRQPHSVIGSTCIGASIVGGVCNSSGGALVRRGPAYTELSLFARKTEDRRLELVNHLGIDLGNDPEEILARVEAGDFPRDAVRDGGKGSDRDYEAVVRDVDADTPGRFNADPRVLYESSGSAGRIAVFALRLDTFATETTAAVYYVGTNDTAALTALRRGLLRELDELPISGEYVHRDCFDIAHRYGKDTLLMIHWLGTQRMPRLFGLKEAVDTRLKKIGLLPGHLLDRVMQGLSRLMPEALPKRMLTFRDRFEHHLILKVAGASREATEAVLDRTVGSEGWFLCTEREAPRAMLHRFSAAGAAVRFGIMSKEAGDILPLDIALRRNDDAWFETLPPEIEEQVLAKIYYGHFFCHVFHQDYVLRKGADAGWVKRRMLELLDTRGAEYPAEHNVGHLYDAKPALADHYRALDPTNSFNPGIGKTPRGRDWTREG